MTAKEKQGFGLYFLFAFGMAWLCQVGGCMALLQQNNAVLYQLALIVTMFCPLLAVLLVQKAFLRQPTGIGWKVQGKRRFWLAAWFGPAMLTLLGAVLYFAVFPSRLDFSGSWLASLPSAICCKTVCLRCSLPRPSICSPHWARRSAGAAT